MKQVIVPVAMHHLPALGTILNHYITQTTVSFYTEALDDKAMAGKIFFTEKHYQTFVLEEADVAIGYCAVTPWKQQQAYRQTAEISIYLEPGRTGKSLGALLLRHAEHFARQHHIKMLIAGLCTENIPSRKLFEKNGYCECACFRHVGNKFGRALDVMYLQKAL